MFVSSKKKTIGERILRRVGEVHKLLTPCCVHNTENVMIKIACAQTFYSYFHSFRNIGELTPPCAGGLYFMMHI